MAEIADPLDQIKADLRFSTAARERAPRWVTAGPLGHFLFIAPEDWLWLEDRILRGWRARRINPDVIAIVMGEDREVGRA